MQSQAFSRRRFFEKMAGVAGVAGLMVVGAGCQSIQEALGPKTGGSGGSAVSRRRRCATWGTSRRLGIRRAIVPRSRSTRSSSRSSPTSRSSGSRPPGRRSARSTWPPGRPGRPRTSACSVRPTPPRRCGSARWRISSRPSSSGRTPIRKTCPRPGGTPGCTAARSTWRRCCCSATCRSTARACSTRSASRSTRSGPGSSSPRRARRSWWTGRGATRPRPASTNRPSRSGAGTSSWRADPAPASRASSSSPRTGSARTTSGRRTGRPITGPRPRSSSRSRWWSTGS